MHRLHFPSNIEKSIRLFFDTEPQGGSLRPIESRLISSFNSLAIIQITQITRSPHLMSCVRETLRGGIAAPPPSDLRLSVSWMKPGVLKKRMFNRSHLSINSFCLFWDFILYLEVPNNLELHFSSLCSPDNAAGGTTRQIYPKKIH